MSVARNLAPPRQGVILLVVVLMLTLFMVVGISFVLYAESEATASRVYREAQYPSDIADIPPELLLAYGLGQLIYDVPDDSGNAFSAMRGHSLARTMYGWNYRPTNNGPYTATNTLMVDPNNTNSLSAQPNLVNNMPYNGIGPLRGQTLLGTNEYDMVNYTWFPGDGFIRDPERPGTRASADATMAGHDFAGGFNAPYTYPDRNSMFLAAVSSESGQTKLLTPSFHRPGSAFGSLDPSNSKWLDKSSQAYKYMSLRPRPADMYYNYANPNDPKNFPLPGDAGGDVKQFPGADFFVGPTAMKNDSIWMDLNYPVQITRSGRKFKPLFAFLVVDLDGRLNLNTSGNLVSGQDGVHNSARQHASNQGLGRWEINISKVLNADANEWRNIFYGNSTVAPPVYGRYANDQEPLTAASSYPDPYSMDLGRSILFPFDFDGVDAGSSTRPVTTKFNMPLPQFTSFPTFGAAYENFKPDSNGFPGLRHPALNQVLRRSSSDTVFNNDNMYHLLAGNYQKSFLNSLIPNNLTGSSAAQGKKIRQLLTTLSYDIDSPGAPPWVTDPLNGGYTLTSGAGGSGYPTSSTPFMTPAGNALGSQSPYGDYKSGDGRANLLSRLNLNRKFAPYRDPSTLQVTPTQAAKAIQDRQQFAKDIFDRLVKATGAVPAALLSGSSGATQQHYDATRYLAQLAANIVDFLDDDDYITTFQWNPTPDTTLDPSSGSAAPGWVFGTEVPKLVLSEAYAEVRNDPNDTMASNPVGGATMPYKLNFFFELHNPMPKTTVLDPATNADKHSVQLQTGNFSAPNSMTPVYQIQVCKQGPAFNPAQDMRAAGNVDGKPGANLTPVLQVGPIIPTTPAADMEPFSVHPQDAPTVNSPAGSNRGFFVMAPDVDGGKFEGGGDPQATIKQTTNPGAVPNALSLDVPLSGSTVDKPTHTVLLRRLACPSLPPDPTPGSPTYNPYVTVDFITNVQTNDKVQRAVNPLPGSPIPPRPEHSQQGVSLARSEPYSANLTVTSSPTSAAGEPRNTFFNHNGGSSAPAYHWLVHLDRPVTNLYEILNVSGFKPHELTQQFVVAGSENKHLAPWADQNSRIYRGLEFFTVGDRSPYAGTNGRMPGKVNINTVFDPEMLDALIDAQTSNFFKTPEAIVDVWQNPSNNNNNVKARKQYLLNPTGPNNDRPFWPMSAPAGGTDPQYPVPGGTYSMGLSETIAGGTFKPENSSLSPPFNSGSTTIPPYIMNELLTKISGHTTTRSNTFAVFLTVGFFEVMDDTTKPVKLGAEIKTSNGKAIRHRMFAIVDRTNLAFDTSTGPAGALKQAANPPVFMSMVEAIPPGTPTATVTVAGGQIPTDYDGNTSVTIGQSLFVNMGTSQEMVTVTSRNTATGQLTLQFNAGGSKFSHPAGTMMCTAQPGNPGPQGPIDYGSQQFRAVVPFTYIIE